MKILKPFRIAVVTLLFCTYFFTSCNQVSTAQNKGDTLINLVSDKANVDEKITTYYLVRHAEKLSDDKDPHLSEAGINRAKELGRTLSDVDLQAVYSTNYFRTKETVKDIASSSALLVEEYNPRDLAGFVANLKSKYTNGEHVLIVGHSNSTPMLANELLNNEEYQKFDEKHYDNLILVVVPNKGIPSSSRLHFGAKNPK